MWPNDPDPSTDVTLAVLAGGLGSRMGRPKADLHVNGTPLAEYLLRAMNWHGPTLLVTAPGRERPPGAAAFGAEAVDPAPGAGPLRGVLTALEHATTPRVIVAAVDMPRVRREQLDWLVGQLDHAPDAAGILCRVEGRLEPLPLALRTNAIGPVRSNLDAGRGSLRSLLDTGLVRAIDAPEHWSGGVWANVNTLDEWEAFLRSIRRPSDLEAPM